MAQLARRLGLGDAVVLGVGAMLGAGVFAAPGPAAAAAGSWLLAGLALAAVVAYANATSSAQLAAVHPQAGGTYVYARERLGPLWGFLAGWSFVVGKTASLAAMALTCGLYVHEPLARPLGVAAVVALTVVNHRGVQKTAGLSRVIVAVVVACLAAAVASMLAGDATVDRFDGSSPDGPWGVVRSAGFLFFAFAGYARIATLGEEVRDPSVVIPRAIPLALGIVVAIYAVVLLAALAAVGPEALAASPAPLATSSSVGWVVRFGAAVACAGVLLSLLAGVGRTAFAMARQRELPSGLDAVHPIHRTPHRAETAVAAVVCVVVVVADVRDAIGFSSFGVLTYYALANASALRLSAAERRWPAPLAALGLGLCLLLAFTLPAASVVGGLLVLGAGAVVRRIVVDAPRPG